MEGEGLGFNPYRWGSPDRQAVVLQVCVRNVLQGRFEGPAVSFVYQNVAATVVYLACTLPVFTMLHSSDLITSLALCQVMLSHSLRWKQYPLAQCDPPLYGRDIV